MAQEDTAIFKKALINMIEFDRIIILDFSGVATTRGVVRIQFGRSSPHINDISHPFQCSKLPYFAWMLSPVNQAALCVSYFPSCISILSSLETSAAFIKIYTFYMCICHRLKKWFLAIINK